MRRVRPGRYEGHGYQIRRWTGSWGVWPIENDNPFEHAIATFRTLREAKQRAGDLARYDYLAAQAGRNAAEEAELEQLAVGRRYMRLA